MFKHILIGFDGSAQARSAFDTAVDMAAVLGCGLTVIQVLPSYDIAFSAPYLLPHAPAREMYESQALAAAQQAVSELADTARARGVDCNAVLRFAANACQAILAHADSAACDLIVLGARGQRSVDPALLGDDIASVLLNARIPVLVNDGPVPRIA